MKHAAMSKDVVVPSDGLSSIRGFLEQFEAFEPFLRHLYQVRVVLDASTVIADVRWLVRNRLREGARTALQEVMASGALVGYAPPILRAEVVRRLSEIAQEEQLSLDALMACWEEYQTQISVCEPQPGHCVAPRDPEDLPYVYLYRSVAAAAVLTYDKDHAAMGVPTVQLDSVLSMRSYARNASVQVSVMLGSTAVAGLTMCAGFSLAKLLLSFAQRLPRPLLIALGLGALFVALHPPSRTKVVELAGRVFKPLRLAGVAILDAAGDVLAQAQTAGLAAQQASGVAREQTRPAKATARSLAFAVLAAADTPLPLLRVLRQMRHAGDHSRAKNPAAYVQRVLRSDDRLQETHAGWQLVHSGVIGAA